MTTVSTLERIEVIRLRLPLAQPWVSPVTTMVERDVLLVAVTIDGVVGWGECVAQPDPTYSSEYVDGALDVLHRHLVPRLLAAGATGSVDVGAVDRALAPVKGHPMAKAALTVAVLDAHLRAEQVSLVDHLASMSTAVDARTWVIPSAVPSGVVVGVVSDLDALIDEVGTLIDEGYHRVKIKIQPDGDVAAVNALRHTFGSGLALQVDANGSYQALGVDEAAKRLGALDDCGLLLIEQPLGDDDLVGHAALARRLATPVCLDESIASVDDAMSALALGACRLMNVKVGRVGGLAPAVAIHDRCAAAGMAVWCGGMLETGVGRAVNLALAALPNFSLPGDLSASDRIWETDVVTEPARLDPDGRITVPRGAGIGVELSPDVDRWLVWRGTWPAW
ncbi:MAG: o-succinylbenzoate synthase [Actinomycetota bacterium]|nr:o-succinylbenzoate synthase [Actinomycetota bacterium]